MWSHRPSHATHWSYDHMIYKHMIYKKGFISTFVRAMATNFSKVWLKLSWPQPSSHVTHLSCDTLYEQKGASPVSQRQLPLNLVGLWSRVKGPHLLFQVTCRSSDHVVFEKRHVSTNARPQNSAGDMKHRKTHKSEAFFCYSKDMNIWFTSIYTTLRISKSEKHYFHISNTFFRSSFYNKI